MKDDPFKHDPLRDIEKMFHQQTFSERMKLIGRGIKADKTSGEYKKAKLELQRLLSPLAAVVIPVLLLGLIVFLAKVVPEEKTSVTAEIVVEDEEVVLDDPPEVTVEPIEPPEPVDFEIANLDVVFDQTVDMESPDDNQSPTPEDIDTVALIKSHVTLKGVYYNRTPGERVKAIKRFDGNGIAEGAVLRGLRWLKVNQKSDGSWGKSHSRAMASLALLAYLAHGEKPESEEFGETVQNAIKYLVKNGKKAANGYECGIVTYAMCEAFGMTKIPSVKEVAVYNLNRVIKGQNPTGGWDYGYKGTETRNDTSVNGWAVQGLKSAKMASIHHDGLKQAYSMAIKGIQANANRETGQIGYTSKSGNPGLTGAGVLALQFLGASKTPECKKGIQYLKGLGTIGWEGNEKNWMGGNPIYYWYYITQAVFQEDAENNGQWWRSWNNDMKKNLVKYQNIEKDAYAYTNMTYDIGSWLSPNPDEHGAGVVQMTTMCTLMLEVYYRYLPTFKPPIDLGIDEDTIDGGKSKIIIEIDV
ncbi:MAG: hypothetical protein PF692_02715 [Kiritimatiellae bacterium]|jgi:hypothetical protein|nr:hypothetical protein [Kiritimatiellia bacterium]